MTVIWIAIIVVGASVFAWGVFAERDVRRLKLYEACAARFYERIGPIAGDDETPPELLDMIAFVSAKVSDPTAARSLARSLTATSQMPEKFMAEHNKFEAASKAFFERRQELLSPYFEAMAAALIAVTFRDRWTGWYARRLLGIVQRHEKVAPMVVADFRDRSDGNNNHHNGPMAQPA